MRLSLLLFILTFLPMSIFAQGTATTKLGSHHNVAGIWGFDHSTPAPHQIGNHPISIMNFLIEGDFLTIRLIDISGMREPGADEFFKLRLKWEGDELFYLPPVGNWHAFADYRNGTFVMYGQERNYLFKRIPADEIPAWNADLLRADRAPFVYDEE